MYTRLLRGVVSIAIVAISVLSQLWPGAASDALSRMVRPSVVLQELRLARVVYADNNEDNSDGDNDDDNGDDDNSNDDNDDDNSGDDNDEDNDDNSGDDNSGDDNDDNGGDDNGGDNGGSNVDEDAVIDNVSPPARAAGAPAPPAATVGSGTEASGTSTGGDSTIALAGERVVVQIFPSMPPGITITVRLVDPATAPAPPGTRVDAMVFRLDARDAAGTPLAALPAEVHLAARYADADVTGLDKQRVTLSWLDPADNRWKPAAKVATDPSTNYVAASVTALGLYAVSAP
jgi:hypothetical protein